MKMRFKRFQATKRSSATNINFRNLAGLKPGATIIIPTNIDYETYDHSYFGRNDAPATVTAAARSHPVQTRQGASNSKSFEVK